MSYCNNDLIERIPRGSAFRFVKLYLKKRRIKKDDDVDVEISFLLTFFFVNKYNFVNKKERGELSGSVDSQRSNRGISPHSF